MKTTGRLLFASLLILVLLIVMVIPVMAASPGQGEQPQPLEGLPVLAGVVVILFLSFLIERLVEAVFGRPFNQFPALTPYKWTLIYIGFAMGTISAFIFQLDLIYLVATYLKLPMTPSWWGLLLTGLAIGGGSTLIHEIMGFFKKPPLTA